MVGKAKWKPLSRKMANQKHYHILGEIIQINATAVKDTKVVFPITSPFTSIIWPMQKIYESGRVIVDYHKLNQVMTLIIAAVVDVALLLEQKKASSYSWHAVIDLEKRLFLHLCPQDSTSDF